jgi:hypothetical protein
MRQQLELTLGLCVSCLRHCIVQAGGMQPPTTLASSIQQLKPLHNHSPPNADIAALLSPPPPPHTHTH